MMLTSGGVLLLAGIALLLFEVLVSRKDMVAHLSSLARATAENCVGPLAFDQPKEAAHVLTSLKGEPHLAVVALYDSSGRIYAAQAIHSSRLETPGALISEGHRFTWRELEVFQPVKQNDMVLGTLYLRSSLEPVYNNVQIFAAFGLLIMVGALAGGYVFSKRLQEVIAEPLSALARTARAVTERNDYSVRAPEAPANEVGVVTEAFNRMLDEIQRRQAALTSSESRLKAVFENLGEGLIVLTLDESEPLQWNAAALQMHDVQDPREIGSWVTALEQFELRELDDRVVPFEQWPIRRLLRGEEVPDWEGRLLRRGTDWERVFSYRAVLVGSLPGQPRLGLLTIRDVTDRYRAQKQLQDARDALATINAELELRVQQRTEKLRDTIEELEHFSYTITHDMRAPLRSMQSFGDILRTEYTDRLDDFGRDLLRRVVESSHRMDNLITDALNYSKLMEEQMSIVPVDVRSLLRGIIESYPEFQPPQAEVRLNGEIPPVMGNRAGLTQCFSNLLSNAVKFVQPGKAPRVEISGESLNVDGEPRVRVWVADNGVGIPKEYQDKIFVMFQRLSKDHAGTGIGLALVKKVVERMGGRVGVDSEPDVGSRFWIELRAATEAGGGDGR